MYIDLYHNSCSLNRNINICVDILLYYFNIPSILSGSPHSPGFPLCACTLEVIHPKPYSERIVFISGSMVM